MLVQSVEKLSNYFSQHQYCRYKKGEIIYNPGDPIAHIAFVKNGFVRLYIVNQEGDEKTLNVFKPVFFLTLLFALTDTKNHYYMEAVTDVELWKAPVDSTVAYIKSDPVLMYELMQRIMFGLRSVLENLEHLISSDSMEKICGLLVSLSKEYGSQQPDGLHIEMQMTHRLLASLTGLTRETVTTKIDVLTRQGVISRQGKVIIIHNLQILRDKAGLMDDSL